ncbi:sensor histidine kinase KdpD [Phenylobacterium sp.]|uniref:sensor histidine kinase n=1 Tax=Phenylobacterium sp. TaxID=1871053 RepID=UPI002736CD38|nr:HAMP domain-containing sensor histidine kinase [Phenylobacterium sp.]MDP3855417.1 HAMP domain-containing sensor histidine kinase [Phenylobacterium sp.]
MAQAAFLPQDPDEPHATAPEPARLSPRARREAALDETKRSFLRMVSHELRTPLNSILGFSEIIAAELYGPLGAPQYKEYAGIIRTSGNRLLKLVNQILEIARLEGRAMDMDLRPEALDHALDDVLDGLREDIATRRTTIMVEGQGALPAVIADARGLRNVLTNLIQNAVTFGPEDATVRIHASSHDGEVEIQIIDQGPGVEPADLPRLLQPFEQGENALTRRSEGAGLGLPIVNLLCLAMNGRLRLHSEPGRGLTATVRLPAA